MSSHDLKLRRAQKHLDELEAEIDRWLHIDGCAITVAPDPEPPAYVVTVQVFRDPNEGELGLMIGDCLQNARSALDCLAYSLGERGAGFGGMTEAQAAESGFPIVGDERDGFTGRGPDLFAGAAARQLQAVTPEARAFIERAQPFQDAPVWEHHYLWKLNELARVDRHRFFHLTAARTGGLSLDPAKSRNIKIEHIEAESGEVYFRKITGNPEDEDTAEIARVIAHPADPNLEMHMHFRDVLSIGWDQDTPGVGDSDDVALDLSLMVSKVWRVLVDARPFLEWPDPPDSPPDSAADPGDDVPF